MFRFVSRKGPPRRKLRRLAARSQKALKQQARKGRKRASRWFAGMLSLLLLIVLASPVLAAPSVAVYRGSSTVKKIALTFDMGSDAGGLPSILSTLAAHQVKSTFFATGAAAAAAPTAAKSILAGGHEIGNHSYTHPDFTKLTAAQMVDELRRTENLLLAQTGQKPRPLFRPPYGALNSAVLQAVGDAGYSRTIMWSIDTIDWNNPPTQTIVDRVLNNAHNGAIVLMHISGTINTRYALPSIITGLKSMGYQLVTVSNLLGLTAPTPPPPTGTVRYTVQAGDTLWKIATMYKVTVDAIVKANNIVNPNLIYVGQVLIIPTTAPAPTPTPTVIRYTVKSGDTLWKISQLYGVTIDAIVKANNIVNPNLIYVGQVLIIPK